MQRRPLFLVASADAGVRKRFKTVLDVEKRDVIEASTGQEAVTLARSRHPRMVLLDAALPGGAAGEALETIRSDPALAGSSPFVLLSTRRSRSSFPEIPSSLFPSLQQDAPSSRAEVDGLFDVSADLLCIVGFDGICRRVNAMWGEVLGYRADQILGKSLAGKVHPDDRAAFEEGIKTLAAGGKLKPSEYRFLSKTGGERRLLWRAAALPAKQSICASARDIATLRAAEDRLRTMSCVVEQSPVSVMITDVNGNIEYVNPRFAEISGFSPEDILGKNPRFLKSGTQPPDVYHELWRTITAGGIWRGALQNLKKNGETFWEHETIAPVRDSGGTINHYVSIKEDVTERRSAEETIRSQAALLDVATDAILIRGLDDRILYWNKGAEKMYGWRAGEAQGKKSLELLSGDPEQHRPALQTLDREGQWQGELSQLTKEGRVIIAECRWTIAPESDGRPATILSINTDVTEKKKLEAQFLRAQRMESIGTLAGGIAHDLNNILGPILLSIDYLRDQSEDAETQRVLNALESSASRGADLVRQVLMFARGVEGEHIVLQPAHLTKDVVKILAETFPRAIRISADLPSDLWTVSGDPTQLHQVLMNLCVNARDAMPEGGQIHITAENVALDAHYVRSNLEAQVGPYVAIAVADTGTGIPPDVIPGIFEPFFTTKEAGKGTGIGLSTVRAIVKSHGGFIKVYSEAGRGSTFKVYIPASAVLREKRAQTVRQGAPHGNGELVLVVDDEIPILEVTKTSLEASGYRVVTAQDGTEALAIYSQLKDDVAVVITDMMMPFLDGAATIRALHKINPRLKVIAASGLEVDGKVKNITGHVDAVLPKPYNREKLLATLADVLTGVKR
jgi:PAS domain S-box-containing protein